MKWTALLIACSLGLAPATTRALTVTTPGTVIQNQTITGDLNILSARKTVIRNVVVTGNFSCQTSDSCVFDHMRVNGTRLDVNKNTLTQSTGLQFYWCEFLNLGKGVTSGEHISLWWNDNATTMMFCKFNITVEAGLPSSSGGEWHFDSRNRNSRGNYTVINLKRDTYAAWRWRSDVGGTTTAKNGCYNNRFRRDTLIVTGPYAARLLPSSSATCDGTKAGCVGHWDVLMDSCLIDARGCATSDVEWQGGLIGWNVSNTTIAAKNYAIHAIDIHSSQFRDCRIDGKVWWDDAYSRPLPVAGDLIYCRNTTTGSTTTDPAIAAVSGWIVNTCGAPPVPPDPPVPPTTPDTVRVRVTVPSLPAIITVVKQ